MTDFDSPANQPDDPNLGDNPYDAPLADFAQAPYDQDQFDPADEGDATGGVIPYKNPCALIAYYLGIVSLLPMLGVPFGLASFILGIIGLRNRKQNPKIKGSVHAWIGIVCGFLSMLCGGALIGSMVLAAVNG